MGHAECEVSVKTYSTHTHRCRVTNTCALMAALGAANDNVKSSQLPRRLIWLPFCLPLSNVLCHTAASPDLKHTHTYTHTPRDAARIMKHMQRYTPMQQISPYFSLPGRHTLTERKPFSLLPPTTAALACHRERHEATLRKQKGGCCSASMVSSHQEAPAASVQKAGWKRSRNSPTLLSTH